MFVECEFRNILSDICSVHDSHHSGAYCSLTQRQTNSPKIITITITDCDWLMNILSLSIVLPSSRMMREKEIEGRGGETNLKWIESICVSFSATIYRKTHDIKIYAHAVVTRTAYYFLSELQKKTKRKINSNGIWLALQISFCYEKVKKVKEKKKTRKKFFIRSFIWARMLFHRCSQIWSNRLLL